MEKIIIKIFGKVQGIGYRWFVMESANKRKLSGWVKNLDDGSVECCVGGIEQEIKEFIEEIKTKHPCAIVDKVEIIKIDSNIKLPEEFIIKH